MARGRRQEACDRYTLAEGGLRVPATAAARAARWAEVLQPALRELLREEEGEQHPGGGEQHPRERGELHRRGGLPATLRAAPLKSRAAAQVSFAG